LFIFIKFLLNKKFILNFGYLTYHIIKKIMTKEFEINDILDAVDSIFEKERKKVKITKIKNDSNRKKDDLTLNNQVKSNKTKILVLGQMIE
tara:strand:+ start:1197 stop:1469 length:273 start_codon:yes stop_codon:yes gene_type:complete